MWMGSFLDLKAGLALAAAAQWLADELAAHMENVILHGWGELPLSSTMAALHSFKSLAGAAAAATATELDDLIAH